MNAKVAGILFILGAIVSVAGEGRPVIGNVFGAFGNPQQQVEFIENDPDDWSTAHLLMGAGSVIAAIGVVLFARHVLKTSSNKNVRTAGYAAAALAVIGAVFWAIVCYNRIAMAPQEVIAYLNTPNWMDVAYFLLTEISIITIGFLLLQTGYPKWFAWPMLVVGGLVLVAGLLLGLPPAVHALLFFIVGIALLLMRSHAAQSSVEPAHSST